MIALTEKEAFSAMTLFLEIYVRETVDGPMPSLLGEIQIRPDGRTQDPAALYEWMNCVKKVLDTRSEASELDLAELPYALSKDEAFAVMSRFLETFFIRTNENADTLLENIQIEADGTTRDPDAWPDWMACVNKIVEARDNG